MLRRRLFLNLLPFLAILAAISFFAMWLVTQIARDAEDLSFAPSTNLMAARLMKVAAAGMHKGIELSIAGKLEAGQAMFDENARLFEEQLEHQLIPNPPPQRLLVDQLRTNYQSFRQAGRSILSRSEQGPRGTVFPPEFHPRSQSVDRLVEQIHRVNYDAIRNLKQFVRKRGEDSVQFMLAAVLVSLVVAAFACYLLSRSILEPIHLLTEAAREVGKGNLDQVVPVQERDELGELARAFNQMATQLREYRQNTTHKLTRLHRTMETALASFPDPIFVMAKTGEIELRNPAATAFSRELGLETAMPLLLHDTVQRVLETGESNLPTSFKDALFFRFKLQEKYYLPRVLVMRNDEGLILGVVIVLLDVTRFRLMDDVKSNLVATVSHELKTPLTSVRMALHILVEKIAGPLTPKQDELVTAARNDAERLLRILNDLLDLTRLEEGSIDVSYEKIPPEELVRRAVEETRESALAKGLTLVAEVDPGLPQVTVDRQRIGHVFTNIISNAVKHSPIGERIVVSAKHAEEGGVCFSVTDRGPGIPDQYHNRIFDKFFRVPGQVRKGAGLGLSIAKEIVVAHGGDIRVRSKPGRGSEFYFILANGRTTPSREEDGVRDT